MRTVGILDYYISNFHSNTYHELFHEIAAKEQREEYVITHVYASLDKSPSTGETTAEWCARVGAVACNTPQEVCEACDVIMVLAPNHPDTHEALCSVAFDSGKPVYVDKTFAPDLPTAKRIAQMGKEKGARFWSSSATRFASPFAAFMREDAPRVTSFSAEAGNHFEAYCIHLVELMNTFMKNGAKTVNCRNNSANLLFEIGFEDGRKAFLHQFQGSVVDFCCYPEKDGVCERLCCGEDFWRRFTCALMDFFDGGCPPVPVENTVECIAVRDALKKAMATPCIDVPVER